VPLDAATALAPRPEGEKPFDVAFLALHGAFGEDGTVQGLLDAAGIPYTGSGVLASALAMDKPRSKAVVASAGVAVARGASVAAGDWKRDRDAVLRRLSASPGSPAFVKPAGGGSSIGAGPADDDATLASRLDEVFRCHDERALVEERLVGREVTCAVLGNRGQRLRALPVVEIVPEGSAFFDYRAKYEPGACREICPARVTAEEAARVEEAAMAAHGALGCDGMSRSDFVLVDGVPVYLETNTIPGLTATSLCPQAARAAGMAFPDLLSTLVAMALSRGARRRDVLRSTARA
jgi:D-alanine-D-alanine ligase